MSGTDEIDWEFAKKSQYIVRSTGAYFWQLEAMTLWRAANIIFAIYYPAYLFDERRRAEEAKKLETDSKFKIKMRILEGEAFEDAENAKLISVYFLLAGFTIENLMKAIIVLEYPEYFEAGKNKNTKVFTHDLVELAALCDLTFPKEQEDFLRVLSNAAIWEGRYPAPTKFSAMPLGYEKMPPPHYVHSFANEETDHLRDREMVNQIANNLINEASTRLKNKVASLPPDYFDEIILEDDEE